MPRQETAAPPARAPGVVVDYFAHINGGRLDAAAELFEESAVVRTPGVPPVRGRDDIRRFLHAAFAPFERHRDEPTRWIVDENVVVVEIAFSGTFRSGREVAFDVLDVLDLADGRLAGMTSWNDSAQVRKLFAAER